MKFQLGLWQLNSLFCRVYLLLDSHSTPTPTKELTNHKTLIGVMRLHRGQSPTT